MFHILIVYDCLTKVNAFWLAKCSAVVANAEPFACGNIGHIAVDILQCAGLAGCGE
jgi:hypothetical protein